MRITQTLLLALATTTLAAPLESEFVATGFRDPMELAIAPDGDIYVVEREGRILRVRPTTGAIFEIGTLKVTALREKEKDSPWAREDGLLGIALDPKFAENQRLFLYYSDPEKLLNRLSRFELRGGKIDLASEKIILEVPGDRRDRVCHHGGSVEFGPDGNLYLSTGDNTNPFESDGRAPIDDRDGRDHVNAMRSAGNTNDLRGKILRIRPTENGYEIPPGNLFPQGTEKARPEIYVMGCRNPFRMSIDPKTGTVYWGEVGPDGQNPDAKGPAGHDEVNQAKKAGNHGWPFVIADNKPYPIVDFSNGQPGAMTDPEKPLNPSKFNTGLKELPPAVPALIWYPYSESSEFPAMGNGGRNAMAGPVFYHDPNRTYNLLSSADNRTLLTYDWMRGKMWKAKLDDRENLTALEVLMEGLNHPMDLEMAADGTLWLLEYGTNWYFNTDGRIRRIRPDDGNQSPKLTVERDSNNPLKFTVKDVSDPENDKITIEWWLNTGLEETKLGTGSNITIPPGGIDLRAVAIDAKGNRTISRVPLVEESNLPALTLEIIGKPEAATFGDALKFKITGPTDPKQTIVRARYLPPTGHDSGGPQLPSEIEKTLTARQCLACHQVDRTSVGPHYLDVALKYRGQADALTHLKTKLKSGGAGVWGEVPMPPQITVTDSEADTLLKAILGLADGISQTRGANEGTLTLSPAPESPQPGGAWEITAEAPGHSPARLRLNAN
jgi:cytochrome c